MAVLRKETCNLRYTATHCNTLQHRSSHCNSPKLQVSHCNTLQLTATHCNSLQHRKETCNLRYPVVFAAQYGATSSRLLKIIGLFCRISSFLYVSFANETYNFKEPASRSHPIVVLSTKFICTTTFESYLYMSCSAKEPYN